MSDAMDVTTAAQRAGTKRGAQAAGLTQDSPAAGPTSTKRLKHDGPVSRSVWLKGGKAETRSDVTVSENTGKIPPNTSSDSAAPVKQAEGSNIATTNIPKQAAEPIGFLDLSGEIRNKIYDELVIDDEADNDNGFLLLCQDRVQRGRGKYKTRGLPPFAPFALAGTCRQIRTEMLSHLYAEVQISVQNDKLEDFRKAFFNKANPRLRPNAVNILMPEAGQVVDVLPIIRFIQDFPNVLVTLEELPIEDILPGHTQPPVGRWNYQDFTYKDWAEIFIERIRMFMDNKNGEWQRLLKRGISALEFRELAGEPWIRARIVVKERYGQPWMPSISGVGIKQPHRDWLEKVNLLWLEEPIRRCETDIHVRYL